MTTEVGKREMASREGLNLLSVALKMKERTTRMQRPPEAENQRSQNLSTASGRNTTLLTP